MSYAPEGSEFLCPSCRRVLATFVRDMDVGDIPGLEDLAIHDALMAANGEPLRCPEHGPVWPSLRRPDGELIDRA